MLSRCPKESDLHAQVQDIHLKEDTPLNETGFYFHKSMGTENDHHQDCGCALARLIGHHQSFQKFDTVVSFWSMEVNHEQLSESSSSLKNYAFGLAAEFEPDKQKAKSHSSMSPELSSIELKKDAELESESSRSAHSENFNIRLEIVEHR